MTACPNCSAEPPPGSAFCNRCAAAVGAPAPFPAAPPPRPDGEPEKDLWSGRYSGKADTLSWVLWGLWLVALLYLWFAVLSPGMRGSAFAPWILAAAAGLPALSLGWTLFVRKLSVRYRLTTHRLFRETGILVRKFNELELLRVDDVSVSQNLLQRAFNVGTIVVVAPTDATEPRVEMTGIESPIEVKELIRTQVRQRRQRSVHLETL
jgi:membrane protein YdbS with pleckstrin-like domain